MQRDLKALFDTWANENPEEKKSITSFSLFLERNTGMGLSEILTDSERDWLVDLFGEAFLEGLDSGP